MSVIKRTYKRSKQVSTGINNSTKLINEDLVMVWIQPRNLKLFSKRKNFIRTTKPCKNWKKIIAVKNWSLNFNLQTRVFILKFSTLWHNFVVRLVSFLNDKVLWKNLKVVFAISLLVCFVSLRRALTMQWKIIFISLRKLFLFFS